jgi:hypothetical protein
MPMHLVEDDKENFCFNKNSNDLNKLQIENSKDGRRNKGREFKDITNLIVNTAIDPKIFATLAFNPNNVQKTKVELISNFNF